VGRHPGDVRRRRPHAADGHPGIGHARLQPPQQLQHGLLPPLSFGKPGTALGGKAPRIINPTMGLSQYQNGTFAPYTGGTFTNPFTVP
jgi:hypothetical protein